MAKNAKPTSLSTFSFWVLSCFFFSGLAGLIYQILWLRMIDKVIGSAPFAVATVLSVFMGGLALGSWLAGKYIDRIASRRDLLSLYGLAELAIGAYGLLLPFLIFAVKPLYVLAYDSLFLHFWLYRIFTFLGCSLLLLVPTTLMGITLPVLCRFYVENLGHIGARTGRLYGINTIGAAAGAALCGFVLLAEFGVWGSIATAAGINIIVGVLCILLARGGKPLVSEPAAATSGADEPVAPTSEAVPSDDKVVITLALWIFGVSGFCAMAYEVFWTRLLGLTIGPTTYSFTLVVSTFIVGLALGNILFGWLADRVKNAFKVLVITQACAACLALLVSQFLGNSQFFFSKLLYTFQGDFGARVLVQSIILFFILIGPTIFLGATFPLVNKIYARSLPNIGRSIGTAYAVNTIGAILGSFVAGFIFIPLVGKENGLRIAAGLQVLVSVPALVYLTFKTGEKIRAFTTGFVTIAVCLLLLVSFPSWNHNTLSRGWYYRFDRVKHYFSTSSWLGSIWKGTSKLAGLGAQAELIFYGDGIGGFTTVEKWLDPIGTANLYLQNSGKTDASSHADRLTQALSAHIPLLFHPNPEKVMVLGLASGMTAGEALLYPVKQLDVLEINDQVIKAAEFFASYNNNCLANPITRMIVQDGRNHLELTKETYDIIISEPSNPWMAGLANLFTLDYFQTVRERLNDGGIFIQWTNSYDMDWEAFSMIGRTFAEVFPDGLLIETITSLDFLLVGFSGERNLDLEIADRNISYAAQSRNITLRDPRMIFNLIVTEGLGEFFGPGALHTDNRPHLEFAVPKNIGEGDTTIQKRIRENRRLSEETRQVVELNGTIDASLDYLALLTAGSAPPFRAVDVKNATPAQQKMYQDILVDYCSNEHVADYDIFPDPDSTEVCALLQVEKIRAHLALNPEDTYAYSRLSKGLRAMGETALAIRVLQQAITLNPTFFEAYVELGQMLASQRKFEEAIAHLSKALQIDPGYAEVYNNLGNIYADQGRFDEAEYHFSEALEIDPDYVKAYNNLGALYAEYGDDDEAIYYFSKAIDMVPEYAAAHNNLGRIYSGQGRFEDALTHFLEAVKIAPQSPDFHNDLGMILGQQGRISEAISHLSEVLRINPDDFMAHFNLGLLFFSEERFEEAADLLFKVIEIHPDDLDARKMLGAALLNLGRLEEAAEQFSEALRLGPGSAELHDNLGVALARMGRLEEAIEHFHKAFDIDDSNTMVRDHLKSALIERDKAEQ